MAEKKRTAPKSAPIGEAAGALANPVAASAAFRKRQEEKHRKKDPKSWENVSKNMSTMNEVYKLSHLQDQYKELYEEVRNLQQNSEKVVKENANLRKENGLCQSEMAKCILQRSSIEGACRALQQQNRELKEKYMTKIKEDEEHRKKTAGEFQDAMNAISKSLEDHRKVNDGLTEDNVNMRKKLGELCDVFKIKENELAKRGDQLDLERQRAEAIQTKLELELRAQQEIHSREMAIVQHNLQKSEKNCNVLLETVKRLQEHLDVYRNQYEGFENTMTESAQVVDNYKHELENLSKQLNILRQESESWKSKYYDTMRALIEMTELKRKQELHLQSLDKKNEQLQKLCRQLQKDRSTYLKSLKEHGIEPATSSSINDLSEEEDGKKVSTPKMSQKEKELQLLKENLKAVQKQLTRLSVDENDKAHINQPHQNSNDTQIVSSSVVLEASTEKIASPDFEKSSSESVANQRLAEPVLESTPSQKFVTDADGDVAEEVVLIDSQQKHGAMNSNGDEK